MPDEPEDPTIHKISRETYSKWRSVNSGTPFSGIEAMRALYEKCKSPAAIRKAQREFDAKIREMIHAAWRKREAELKARKEARDETR